MAIDACITSSTAGVVGGDGGRFYGQEAVCRDLAAGWTLHAGRRRRAGGRRRADLRTEPEKLALIGARFCYIAKLSGYRLPSGMCICGEKACVCRTAHEKDEDEPGRLILIGAAARKAGDRNERDVLCGDRYDEPFRPGYALAPAMRRVLTERWNRVHARSRQRGSEQLARWRTLNELAAFLAEQDSDAIRLADPPLDEDELSEGQLVLIARSAREAESAGAGFVYRLPRLEVGLRVEDVDRERILLDCGDQDPVRVQEHLRRLAPSQRRLGRDRAGTEEQLERARFSLRDAAADERLSALIQRPSLALQAADRPVEAFFNPELDEGQRGAVAAALAAEDVLVVQGPPGTGKTTFICETVLQLLARDPRTCVLLAAQTHQAIDNVLKHLAAADPELPMARIGSRYVAQRMDPVIRDRYWVQSPEPWRPRVRLRAEEFGRMATARIRAGDASDPGQLRALLEIQREYFVSTGDQRTEAQRLSSARVIAGTCFAVSASRHVRARRFPVALLEEAGKATPPEALMLVLRARRSILIGDGKQLPPHVWERLKGALRDPRQIVGKDPESAEEAARLAAEVPRLGATPAQRERAAEETLFEHFAAHLHGTEHETTLTTQYRMLPAIGELVSEAFYGKALRHGRTRARDPRVSAFAGDVEVRLLDVVGGERKEGPESRSVVRDAEVERIRMELEALQRHAAAVGPVEGRAARLGVALVTPYAGQARRLAARLDFGVYPDLALRVGIVDRFQGDEDCVVIVSFARTSRAGFLDRFNRVNVALSRAQDLLVVVTDVRAALAGRIGEPLQRVVGAIDRRVQAGDARYELLRAAKVSNVG